jgi:RNA polymerase sigma-70 factor (ECF subfamily)
MDFFTFDDEYLRRLREGDRWTVEHFYSYFQELLLIKLRGRLPSRDAIDDVRQEVFSRFFKALESPGGGIRDGRKIGPYVNTICNNVLFENFRQGKRTEPLSDDLDLPTSEDVVSDLINSQERERVRKVVSGLPKKDADILRALFLEELPKDDVCRKFGVDRGYLRVLLHRAKEKFREAWRGNDVVKFRRDDPPPPPPPPKPGSGQ